MRSHSGTPLSLFPKKAKPGTGDRAVVAGGGTDLVYTATRVVATPVLICPYSLSCTRKLSG